MTVDQEHLPILDATQLIDNIYALALDPSGFPQFLAGWREALTLRTLSIKDITPHLEQAVQLLDRLEQAEGDGQQSTNQTPHIVFQVDSSGEIHSANDFTRKFIDAAGQLPISQQSDQELRKLAREVATTESPRLERFYASRDSDAEEIVFLVSNISRLPIRPNSAQVICTSVLWPVGLDDFLKKTYAFSKAELAVIRMLVDGKNSRDIASIRNRSWETVRTQLRKILKKSGVENQLDLVRLVLGYLSNFTNDLGVEDATQIFSFQTLETDDACVTEFLELGNKRTSSGTLLFLHGFEHGHMPSRQFLNLAQGKGKHLIAPLRMGFGATTMLNVDQPHRAILPLIQDTDSLQVIACGSGFHTALQLANALPEKVSSITAIDPWLPKSLGLSTRQGHLPWVLTMEQAMASVPFLLTAMGSYFPTADPKQYLAMLYRHSTLDLALIEKPETLREIVWLYQKLNASPLGACFDIEDASEDWADEIAQAKTAITVVSEAPLRDGSTQVDTSALAELNPGHIRCVSLPSHGQFLLHSDYCAEIIDLD